MKKKFVKLCREFFLQNSKLNFWLLRWFYWWLYYRRWDFKTSDCHSHWLWQPRSNIFQLCQRITNMAKNRRRRRSSKTSTRKSRSNGQPNQSGHDPGWLGQIGQAGQIGGLCLHHYPRSNAYGAGSDLGQEGVPLASGEANVRGRIRMRKNRSSLSSIWSHLGSMSCPSIFPPSFEDPWDHWFRIDWWSGHHWSPRKCPFLAFRSQFCEGKLAECFNVDFFIVGQELSWHWSDHVLDGRSQVIVFENHS